MSTRCQIRFVFPDGAVLTYQHSDGYPTYAVANIVEFLKWNKGRNKQYDYVIPNWFYFNKKGMEQYCDRNYDKDFNKIKVPLKDCYALNFNDPKYANDHNLSTKIGYGLDYHNTLHGDIEYFYDITFADNSPENFIAENISFTIQAYKPKYDYKKHELMHNNPESLIKNTDPFYTLQIASIDNIQDISKELEFAERKASEISEREYQEAKASGLVNY